MLPHDPRGWRGSFLGDTGELTVTWHSEGDADIHQAFIFILRKTLTASGFQTRQSLEFCCW